MRRYGNPRTGLLVGIIFLLGGIIATGIGYAAASSTHGFFVIWWGAVVFGIVRIIISIIQLAGGGTGRQGAAIPSHLYNTPQQQTTQYTSPQPTSYYGQYTTPPVSNNAPAYPNPYLAANPYGYQRQSLSGGVKALIAVGITLGVILILGILAAIVIPIALGITHQAQNSTQRIATNPLVGPQPAAGKSQSATVPQTLVQNGYYDWGNGIAIKNGGSECRISAPCFMYTYEQYNNTCPDGITVTMMINDDQDNPTGQTKTVSAGNALDTPTLLEFSASGDERSKLTSAVCAK